MNHYNSTTTTLKTINDPKIVESKNEFNLVVLGKLNFEGDMCVTGNPNSLAGHKVPTNNAGDEDVSVHKPVLIKHNKNGSHEENEKNMENVVCSWMGMLLFVLCIYLFFNIKTKYRELMVSKKVSECKDLVNVIMSFLNRFEIGQCACASRMWNTVAEAILSQPITSGTDLHNWRRIPLFAHGFTIVYENFGQTQRYGEVAAIVRDNAEDETTTAVVTLTHHSGKNLDLKERSRLSLTVFSEFTTLTLNCDDYSGDPVGVVFVPHSANAEWVQYSVILCHGIRCNTSVGKCWIRPIDVDDRHRHSSGSSTIFSFPFLPRDFSAMHSESSTYM